MGLKQRSFWGDLNYSSSNEDGYSELRALDLCGGDSACCITGSGDRVLHLLLGDPEIVYALDMNPVQNWLLELKTAAIGEFGYDAYARFLGLLDAPGGQRLEWYARLRSQLTPEASDWFDSNRAMIARGVLYSGRWERFFAMTSRNLRIQRGRKIDRLLSFRTADEQREFVRREWDTKGWRLSLRLAFSRPVCRYVFGDPGFYANVGGALEPWRYIHGRFNGYLENHPARESFMLALVLKGTFFDPVHYPPYLREENFDKLKARLGRIRIRTASLGDFLASGESRECNKFSLSDVSSFLDDAAYSRLIAELGARSGVRFCMRDFLTQRTADVAKQRTGGLRFLHELQDELGRDDASIGYTFIIGQVD